MNTSRLLDIAFLPLERRKDSSKEPQQPMCRYPDLVEGLSPRADLRTAEVSDSSAKELKRIVAHVLCYPDVAAAGIQQLRRQRHQHELFVGNLLTMLDAEQFDEVRDMVKDEYAAIHGPSV